MQRMLSQAENIWKETCISLKQNHHTFSLLRKNNLPEDAHRTVPMQRGQSSEPLDLGHLDPSQHNQEGHGDVCN